MNWQDLTIIGPALVAGLLVLATHVPLGFQVLNRGIIFVDLALAQFAGLGVIGGHALGIHEDAFWLTQAAALTMALAGALLIYYAGRWLPEWQEAIIGCLFVLAAATGVVLLTHDVHAGEQIKEILSGQILWVSDGQLIAAGVVALLSGLAMWRFNLATHPLVFFLLFAVNVTVSVQLVGVYLVFASLIVPALATVTLKRFRYASAYALGAVGYIAGLWLSLLTDAPSAALIVVVLTVLGGVMLVLSVRHSI